MKMLFKDDDMVTIVYGEDSWKVRKQYIADYLSGKFEATKETSMLEKAIILTYLPFTDDIIVVYAGDENHIAMSNIPTVMEVSEELKNFLISK